VYKKLPIVVVAFRKKLTDTQNENFLEHFRENKNLSRIFPRKRKFFPETKFRENWLIFA
jgi:hypothetical protein